LTRWTRSVILLTTMGVNNITERLTHIGFSGYEAKAYAALLSKNPITAYELAKTAGIPTSKIYEVLSRLSQKRVVSTLGEDGARKYVPLDPDEFIAEFRSGMEANLKALGEDLHQLTHETAVSYIWNILDHGYLMEKAHRTILDAKKDLLVSIWKEELALLDAFFEAAEGKGVRIAMVHFGVPSVRIGQVYPHPIEETLYKEKGGRGLVIVADSEIALMADLHEGDKVEGAWSTNKGFVTLAEDYIKHDIYIMKVVRRFNRELIDKFGARYEHMRDVFEDKERT
jgi:sugar-specific transcriptional regulator TrmB